MLSFDRLFNYEAVETALHYNHTYYEVYPLTSKAHRESTTIPTIKNSEDYYEHFCMDFMVKDRIGSEYYYKVIELSEIKEYVHLAIKWYNKQIPDNYRVIITYTVDSSFAVLKARNLYMKWRHEDLPVDFHSISLNLKSQSRISAIRFCIQNLPTKHNTNERKGNYKKDLYEAHFSKEMSYNKFQEMTVGKSSEAAYVLVWNYIKNARLEEDPVLELKKQGLSIRAIAKELGISTTTVQKRIKNAN